MTALPSTTHIRLELKGPVLHLWLNRPEIRNALSRQMTDDIAATFAAIRDDRAMRIVIIRGAGGTFCAGGDLKNMAVSGAAPQPGAPDDLIEGNLRFGRMLQAINSAPQAIIAAVEGHAMGGGIGFASVADVTIAAPDAMFQMSEVRFGIVPAAISPFVVRRIGLTAARRFGVSGARLTAREAAAVGLAHIAAPDKAAFEAEIIVATDQILKCAPGAVAETKMLMLAAAEATPITELLGRAALSFAAAVRGAEGQEGTRAFVEKRAPQWVVKSS
ncbi:MAG: enoyl-CoA hydratase-related protein [Hyphomicrobiaceae bacterium]